MPQGSGCAKRSYITRMSMCLRMAGPLQRRLDRVPYALPTAGPLTKRQGRRCSGYTAIRRPLLATWTFASPITHLGPSSVPHRLPRGASIRPDTSPGLPITKKETSQQEGDGPDEGCHALWLRYKWGQGCHNPLAAAAYERHRPPPKPWDRQHRRAT
jgi:hypothetical protein